jgi:hypothetical protein
MGGLLAVADQLPALFQVPLVFPVHVPVSLAACAVPAMGKPMAARTSNNFRNAEKARALESVAALRMRVVIMWLRGEGI